MFVSDLQTSLMFERQATHPNADDHDMLTLIIMPYLGKWVRFVSVLTMNAMMVILAILI